MAANTDLRFSVSGTRLDSKHEQIGTGAQTGIQFRRLPVRPQGLQIQTDPRVLVDPEPKDTEASDPTCYVQQLLYLIGLLDSYREVSPSKSAPCETDLVASEKSLEDPIHT